MLAGAVDLNNIFARIRRDKISNHADLFTTGCAFGQTKDFQAWKMAIPARPPDPPATNSGVAVRANLDRFCS
jgi:hypothetical protein